MNKNALLIFFSFIFMTIIATAQAAAGDPLFSYIRSGAEGGPVKDKLHFYNGYVIFKTVSNFERPSGEYASGVYRMNYSKKTMNALKAEILGTSYIPFSQLPFGVIFNYFKIPSKKAKDYLFYREANDPKLQGLYGKMQNIIVNSLSHPVRNLKIKIEFIRKGKKQEPHIRVTATNEGNRDIIIKYPEKFDPNKTYTLALDADNGQLYFRIEFGKDDEYSLGPKKNFVYDLKIPPQYYTSVKGKNIKIKFSLDPFQDSEDQYFKGESISNAIVIP